MLVIIWQLSVSVWPTNICIEVIYLSIPWICKWTIFRICFRQKSWSSRRMLMDWQNGSAKVIWAMHWWPILRKRAWKRCRSVMESTLLCSPLAANNLALWGAYNFCCTFWLHSTSVQSLRICRPSVDTWTHLSFTMAAPRKDTQASTKQGRRNNGAQHTGKNQISQTWSTSTITDLPYQKNIPSLNTADLVRTLVNIAWLSSDLSRKMLTNFGGYWFFEPNFVKSANVFEAVGTFCSLCMTTGKPLHSAKQSLPSCQQNGTTQQFKKDSTSSWLVLNFIGSENVHLSSWFMSCRHLPLFQTEMEPFRWSISTLMASIPCVSVGEMQITTHHISSSL